MLRWIVVVSLVSSLALANGFHSTIFNAVVGGHPTQESANTAVLISEDLYKESYVIGEKSGVHDEFFRNTFLAKGIRTKDKVKCVAKEWNYSTAHGLMANQKPDAKSRIPLSADISTRYFSFSSDILVTEPEGMENNGPKDFVGNDVNKSVTFNFMPNIELRLSSPVNLSLFQLRNVSWESRKEWQLAIDKNSKAIADFVNAPWPKEMVVDVREAFRKLSEDNLYGFRHEANECKQIGDEPLRATLCRRIILHCK